MKRIALYRIAEFGGFLAPTFTFAAALVSVEAWAVLKFTGHNHMPSELALGMISLVATIACFLRVHQRLDSRPWARNIYTLNGFA